MLKGRCVMFSRISTIAVIVILCAAMPVLSLDKPAPRFEPISKPNFQMAKFGAQSSVAAVQCTTATGGTIAWEMRGWISGNELFKGYINPSLKCTNPYPYTITSVAMLMYAAKGKAIDVSVDIETADNSNPSCAVPGNVLSLSSGYTFTPSASGYYALWIPLDSPAVVNEPFFAGFYFGTTGAAADSARLLLDADPQHCQSYDIWDTAIGFVDLTNFPPPFPADSFDFPGRLAMEVAGTPGGSTGSACCHVAAITTTDFGTVNYPQTKDLQFTVTNCGSTTLNVTASETCSAFTLPSGGGSFSVAAGESHTTTVRFIPPSAGAYSCTVNLNNTACSAITFTGTSGVSPKAAWVMPTANTVVLGKTQLWVRDTSGSATLDYAVFEYSNGGSYVEIGRDFDGTSPIRDGVNSIEASDGFSTEWNAAALPEGNYTLRATIHDLQSRTSVVTLPVYLEPTPPVPAISAPINGSDLCSAFKVFAGCPDANMQQVQVFRHDAVTSYSNGIIAVNQHTFGDANSNPGDGNNASSGEYGDYYSGPAAAALLVNLWNDRGYTQIMKSGGVTMTLAAAAESLATAFGTRAKKGTSDEQLLGGLQSYASARGAEFTFDFVRDPEFFTVRTWAEEEQRGVLLGLSGAPGFWVTVTGFDGLRQDDGNYLVTVADPLTGLTSTCEYGYTSQLAMLYIDGVWHRVDVAISMTPKNWTVTRQLIGTDHSGADGWMVPFDPSGMTEGNLYFIKAIGLDSTGYTGSSTVLTRYTCATNYAIGDFNGDNAANLIDLGVLVDFVIHHRNPPVGGNGRADCNCDNILNMADIVYYINYLLGTGSAPCH
jgi:hypothetical protein